MPDVISYWEMNFVFKWDNNWHDILNAVLTVLLVSSFYLPIFLIPYKTKQRQAFWMMRTRKNLKVEPCSFIFYHTCTNFMTPFYIWHSTASRLHTETLRGDSLLVTNTSPGCPGTHLIDLGRMKVWTLTIVLSFYTLGNRINM